MKHNITKEGMKRLEGVELYTVGVTWDFAYYFVRLST